MKEYHGLRETKLYGVWTAMRGRCYNITNMNYSQYGGRGIRICPEWESFTTFHNWAIKAGYKEGLTIERINNDLWYTPDNCRWATRKEQGQNTRRARKIQAFEEVKTATAWALDPRCVVSKNGLLRRLDRGWAPEKAITMPSLR